MTERTVVTSWRGLYDEEAEAVIMRVDRRKFCLKHKWVNASLMWESAKRPDGTWYSIDLENRVADPQMGIPVWGTGYGGIRFCRRCKQIGCIHLWDKEKFKVYVIESGPHYHEERFVGTCKICGLRVSTGGCGVCKPVPDAQRIIADEYQKLNGVPYDSSRFGSGWSCEFPVHISNVLSQSGEEAARQAARFAFASGDISNLMRN